MEDILMHPVMMAAISGGATLLGAILAILINPGKKLLAASLGFAGGVMLTVSLTDLIPEGMNLVSSYITGPLVAIAIGAACLTGILIGVLLDSFIPEGKTEKETLYHIGLLSMIGLVVHNIPEGLALYLSSEVSARMGLSLAFAIGMHNIPEGISIAVPVVSAGKGKTRALFMAFLASIAEPIGAVAGMVLFKNSIGESSLGLIFVGIAGLMIYIAIAQLFPTAFKGHPKWGTMGAFAGTVVMLMSLLII